MIYIVEDDASIRELEQYALQTNGYQVQGFEDGRSFWAAVRQSVPDLVILDVMLPDEDGYQILARLREDAATRSVPVLMVTANPARSTWSKGWTRCGRLPVQAVRHHGVHQPRPGRAAPRPERAASAPAALRFGPIALDDVTRTVTVEEEPVELTFKEYALLHFFLEHPEEVLARERIMKAVWDTDDLLESRTIDMHVRTLRQKLGEAGENIRTVRKVGYKLSARVPESGEGGEGGDET